MNNEEKTLPQEADGLFMVDLRNLELTEEQCEIIEKAIQDAVLKILADLDESEGVGDPKLGLKLMGFSF